MTVMKDAKFEQESNGQFKIYMKNQTNSDLGSQKSKKFAL